MLLLWLLLLLLLGNGIVHARPLMDAVRLQLMIDQVVLGLAPLAAYVALRPRVRRRPVRMDVFHVLS